MGTHKRAGCDLNMEQVGKYEGHRNGLKAGQAPAITCCQVFEWRQAASDSTILLAVISTSETSSPQSGIEMSDFPSFAPAR